jgi:hypothetical protein
LKKSNREKKSTKLIKILKKPADSVRFWFYKPKTEKIKPNRTQTKTKPSQTKKTEPNRFELVFFIKNWIGSNRNWLVWTGFDFFIKNFQFGYFFISLKQKKSNRIEPKLKQNRAKPKKPSKTGLNWFFYKKLNRIKPKLVGLNWFWFFKKKFSVWLLFFL